jgi:hypothetical protein
MSKIAWKISHLLSGKSVTILRPTNEGLQKEAFWFSAGGFISVYKRVKLVFKAKTIKRFSQ